MSARRRRGEFSEESLSFLEHVHALMERLRAYWPLTLRQIHYQLVGEGYTENTRNAYQKLSRVLAKARLLGIVPWESMEDRTRTFMGSAGWEDGRDFVLDQLHGFLRGYRRDLLQTQDVALELFIEKDALSRICHEVAFEYCVPVVVARGFNSVSHTHQCRERIESNAADGKLTKLLFFGDLDPSGWAMLPAILTTLQEEMGLHDEVDGIRCALNPDQVEEYRLPRSLDAIKRKDPRARKYVERFGDLAVEIDALQPALLQDLIRRAIEEHLDLELLQEEKARQEDDGKEVHQLRDKVQSLVRSSLAGEEDRD